MIRTSVLVPWLALGISVSINAQGSSTLPTGNLPVSVAAADLDGDGDNDLVSANQVSNNLTLFFQTAPGVFTTGPSALPTGNSPASVAAADLDGDGDNDLVSANRGSNNLTLFFQTAPGVFTTGPSALPTGNSPASVAAADLDGDGDNDLVSANQASNNLTLFFQAAPGVFTTGASALPTGNSPVSVAAADLDGDGDNDLVSANQASNNLTLFFQTTPGVFMPGAMALFTGTSSTTFFVAAADLDGDGDNDLVSANLTGILVLFFQNTPGFFGGGTAVLSGGSPASVAAADLDGDGDNDLVSANRASNDLKLFLQTAPGLFKPRASALPTGLFPASVAAADLDGDGDNDLVSADRDSNNLTLFFLGQAQAAQAGAREPGSLLIYPVHRSGGGFFTVVSVTNTNLQPATVLSLGGSTNVHFQYVNVVPNPANPFQPLACTVFDRVEALTPADTLSVLTSCHNATFGGQEGYLVVTAENPSLSQVAWSHNHLLGSELVLSATGISYSIEAIALQSPRPAGQPTDANNNGRTDFNGLEYEQLPDLLYIDSFIAFADAQLALINFTGTDQDTNTMRFSVWNDFEFPLSTSLVFKCWFDQRLSRISSLFTVAFLVNLPNDPNELDTNCDNVDDFETGWAIIQSVGVRNPGGTLISPDGAILGALTTSAGGVNGGRLLAESSAKQSSGSFGVAQQGSLALTLTETFQNASMLDENISSGTWNNGARPGLIGGDGRHGRFDPSLGTTVSPTEFNWDTASFVIPAGNTLANQQYIVTDGRFYFTEMTVPAGVVVNFTGPVPPKIWVRGKVDIQGSLRVNGAPMATFNARGLTSAPAPFVAGQPGGLGGAGGGRGGRGGNECQGAGPIIVGGQVLTDGANGEDLRLLAGHAYAPQSLNTGGGGAGMNPPTGIAAPNSPLVGSIYRAFFAPGGGGGGFSGPGGVATVTPIANLQLPATFAPGGVTFNPMPLPPGFTSLNHFTIGGSGGGGGATHAYGTIYVTGDVYVAGSGGSGGGGACAIRAGSDLVVASSATCGAKGGAGALIDGRDAPNANNVNWGISSPGGGGSGGSFLLQSGRDLTVSGVIDTSGGNGSRTGQISTPAINVASQAGAGSPGYYRVEAAGTVTFNSVTTSTPNYQASIHRGLLTDRDEFTGCASTWYATNQLFPPTWLGYELDVDIDGDGIVDVTYTDSGAAGTQPANDPIGPVRIQFQGGWLTSGSSQPHPTTIGPWRDYVGAGIGPGIGLDSPNACRFMMTFNRGFFPNCVVRGMRASLRT